MAAPATAASTATQPATKDAITCHILDTTHGKPARGVRVQLEGPSSTSTNTAKQTPHAGGSAAKIFESQTDDDGRVKAWLPFSDETSAGDVPTYTLTDVLDELDKEEVERSTWTLRFFTEDYWTSEDGGKQSTFFPECVVKFTVIRGQTYHVPLLLSPYSYSTYRGS